MNKIMQKKSNLKLLVESIAENMERQFKVTPDEDEPQEGLSIAAMTGFASKIPRPSAIRKNESKKGHRILHEIIKVADSIWNLHGNMFHYYINGRSNHLPFRCSWIYSSSWRPHDDDYGSSKSHGGKLYSDEFFVEICGDNTNDDNITKDQVETFTSALETIMKEEFTTEEVTVSYVAAPSGDDEICHEWVVHFKDNPIKQ